MEITKSFILIKTIRLFISLYLIVYNSDSCGYEKVHHMSKAIV